MVHLGANGVPLGPKNGSKPQKFTLPQKSNFSTSPRSSFFRKKNGSYGYGAKSRWGPPNGPSWGQCGPIVSKIWVKTVKNYHAPKFEFSTTLWSSNFRKKMEVTVMAPNHGGDPLGSILGPMGSHCVQNMCQNRKKLPCPKIRIFDYPVVINFSQNLEVTVMVPNHSGDPLGSILGPMGSHWVEKNGSKPQKLTMPQNLNFRLPCGHRFF